MSRILFAWELGANLGHITPLLVLAQVLRERGHEVVFALRDIRNCAALLEARGFPFLQAPIGSGRAKDIAADPASYPEMLLRYGFADPQGLLAAARAWRNLYATVAPDLIVFDHSPIALLAAHDIGLPRVLYGMGFVSPPRVSPMPSFRPWENIPAARLEASEARALEATNTALKALGAQPLGALHELFDVEEDILTTFPELDHYQGRQGARYWGPVFGDDKGAVPVWPEGEGKKVFVYIRPNTAAFKLLVAALSKIPARVLWFAPGLPAQTIQQLQTPSMRLLTNPLDTQQVAASADAAFLHAGHGTSAAMLLGGAPMLLFPQHVEQMLIARNVAALGAGLVAPRLEPRTDLAPVLARFLEAGEYKMCAETFAAQHQNFRRHDQVHDMVLAIDRILKVPTLQENRTASFG